MTKLSEEHILDPLKIIKTIMKMLFELMDEAYSFYKLSICNCLSVRKGPYMYKKNAEKSIIGSQMYLCYRKEFYNTHIVVFFTTYNTSEYSFIFALFTGINQHEESSVFWLWFYV